MTWVPQHKHVSQIHADGSGWDDCFQSSLARYLYENGTFAPTLDPLEALNQVSWASRGAADSQANIYTTLPECATALAHFKLPEVWTTDYHAVMSSPWSICLVDGRYLSPKLYPDSWFGSAGPGPNHFVLSLPTFQGSDLWLNNPLAYSNGQQDAIQDMTGSFYGAYILPTTNHGETAPARVKALVSCGLLPQHKHGAHAIAQIPVGGECIDLGQPITVGSEVWRFYQYRDKYGWVPSSKFP